MSGPTTTRSATGAEGAADPADPSSPAFWARRYAEGQPRWDQGRPAPPLARAIAAAGLGPGHRAFVPGCGFGHEALELARRGCHVTAVDFVPAAVDGLRARAAAEGLAVDARVADLFEPPPPEDLGAFDVVVEHTCFCAIPPRRRPDYARLAASLLRPGSLLLGLFYEADVPIDEGPPYVTTRADVVACFAHGFELEELNRPPDSVPHRQGREWLARLRRTGPGAGPEVDGACGPATEA